MDTALAGWRWPVAELPRAPAPQEAATLPEPRSREALPAAYRNVAEVDVEAEVAAFANKDEP
jgi:hypothetical protein